jgi:hypothetical protein
MEPDTVLPLAAVLKELQHYWTRNGSQAHPW